VGYTESGSKTPITAKREAVPNGHNLRVNMAKHSGSFAAKSKNRNW
jgi:hypothetical protein